MLLTAVKLRDFRTYERAELELAPGLTVLHGANGAGKSNLLEALFYVCTGHSPRTRNDRELVRFDASATRIEAAVDDRGDTHRLSLAYSPAAAGEPAVKRMSVDGAVVERMTDVAARPLVSFFSPERLGLIKGPPATRRAHIDRFAAALRPLAAADRQAYGRALAQRNALLSRLRTRPQLADELDVWDIALGEHALALTEDRRRALALVQDVFLTTAAELGLAGRAEILYRPQLDVDDAGAFAATLRVRRAGDIERGFTSWGPHRDEIAIRRDGRDLRSYGSQGEQRLAVLALLMAERAALDRERGTLPLMLLDDVMSELDAPRRERLAGELARAGQSVLASTDLDHVPGGLRTDVRRVLVTPGSLLAEAALA